MNRREWLCLAGSCFFRPQLAAADVSRFYYPDYSKCLPNYLRAVARRAYEKRNREISLLSTPQAIEKRQSWVRETCWTLVGGEPARTPLNPRITGRLERNGYRLEKVVYESWPSVFVTANLYVPTNGRPPYPGVLFQMGHTADGKAAASYQKCCQGLARLGYVVLGFDPIGQGERIDYPDSSGTKTDLSAVTQEHSLPGKQLLLLGDSASRYLVWDAIRSLDYLLSHPVVDRERLASVGQSGGGTLTMLLACLDSRLSAAAVCSGNTENEACADFDPPGSPADAEQDLIGSGRVGLDRWDLLYPLAPKPLLIMVSQHDFFGTYSPRYLSSGREEYEKLAEVYATLRHGDRIEWRDTPVPHSLSYSLRLDIYNWFERCLKNSERRIESESAVNPEHETVLWVGATGNVHRDFGSLRPIDLIRQQARATQPTAPERWREALQLSLPARELKFRTLATTASGGCSIAAVEVPSAPEVWVPAWLLVPDSHEPNPPGTIRPTVLLLDPAGRNEHIGEDDVYPQLARSGCLVCAADIRGIGDSRPEVGSGNPAYTIRNDSEEQFAWASLILGDSLLTQRIEDILGLIQAIRNEPAAVGRRLVVAARGALTVPALFAFAASPLADSLYLSGGLGSYRSLLDTERYSEPLANFAWNLFRTVDLPFLAAETAPRRVHLAGAIDALGNRMDSSAVRGMYRASNVTVLAEPAWDERVLGSL